MADVAARAGVSVKTVSRVINGEAYVTAATALRVQGAVEELGFRANLTAATLARGRGAGTIGLIIGDVADPFYARLARGVEQVAASVHHVVLVASSEEDAEREAEIVAALADRHVAGMIAVPTAGGRSWRGELLDHRHAVVFVDRPGDEPDIDCVLTDNDAGAQAGVTYLIEQGRRRIAFVGNDPSVYTSEQRLAGYRRAHRLAGVPVDESLIVLGPRSVTDAEAAVAGLLAGTAPPDAVFGQNDLMSMGAWRAAHRAGTPTAIVGFDDFDLADVLDPPVTVVLQDAVELGRRAAVLLFERINAAGDGSGVALAARAELVPTRLVVRK
jgi:LacI family transcriptional regulator